MPRFPGFSPRSASPTMGKPTHSSESRVCAPMTGRHLRYPLLLSILAAIVTFGLKWLGYLLTGSVGVLSDAAEAGVNLFAASAAYLSVWYSAQPVDREHTYGHEKIEFFDSGLEGILILATAVVIVGYSFVRLLARQHYLEEEL